MKPINFPTSNVTIKGEDITDLPAYYDNRDGSLLYCMELDPSEIQKINETGLIWIKQHTNGEAVQSVSESIKVEDLLENPAELLLYEKLYQH